MDKTSYRYKYTILNDSQFKFKSGIFIIGAVNQEPVLFSGTIRDNILYGLDEDEKINEEDFQRVIKEAHVIEFVKQLPDGLNTLVGQRGIMLSGGQKQRGNLSIEIIFLYFNHQIFHSISSCNSKSSYKGT